MITLTMDIFHPQPTRQLPVNYTLRRHFNAKDPRTSLAMNANGLAALFLFGWLFFIAAVWLRPEAAPDLMNLHFSGSALLVRIIGLLVLVMVMIYLHEGIHGACFWLATHARPKFGFRTLYAYAAAPEWYIPRDSYLWIGLAPFLLISILGILLIAVVPAGAIAPILVLTVMNASGSVGDLWVVFLLLRQPANALANDTGDEVKIYAPQS